MAYFIARVELHEQNGVKPTYDDYERLHAAMQKRKYFRVIRGSDGSWYHMPHATYSSEFSNKDSKAVLDEVTVIAQAVWAKAGKLITTGPSTWIGLPPASPEDVRRLTS